MYCAVHDDSKNAERVPCPFNSRHTVRKAELESHSKVCPDRLRNPSHHPCFSADVNYLPAYGNCQPTWLPTMPRPPDGMNVEEIVPWMEACIVVLGGVCPVVCDERTMPQLCDYVSQGNPKHALQRSALLAKVAECCPQFMTSPCLGVLELGAGKAGLAEAVKRLCPCSFVGVVDRGHFRDVRDKALQYAGTPLYRVRMDVKDCDAVKLLAQCPWDSLASTTESSDGPCTTPPLEWCIVGKHLCGECTDFALNFAVKLASVSSLRALCIATCCHQLCQWGSYSFPQIFRSNEGAFHAVLKLTSWAVGGDTVDEEKRRIGRLAKKLLDLGRCSAMLEGLAAQGSNMTVRYVQYCDASLSPENSAIVVSRESA